MEIQRIRLIRFTWPEENYIHKNNDADGKLQKVSGRCLSLNSDHYVFSLRTSTKVRQTILYICPQVRINSPVASFPTPLTTFANVKMKAVKNTIDIVMELPRKYIVETIFF